MAVELHKEEVQLANQCGGDNSPVTESFRAVDRGGDGNCLFYVFRAHNRQRGETVQEVRSQICAYMRKYRTKQARLCDAQGVNRIDETIQEYVQKESSGSFDNYMDRMDLNGVYGGEVEIMCASMMYQKCIRVWHLSPCLRSAAARVTV